MGSKMVDVTIHVDETLPAERRAALTDILRDEAAVFSACYSPEHQHLMVVEYDPDRIHSHELLELVKRQGVHAQLIGL